MDAILAHPPEIAPEVWAGAVAQQSIIAALDRGIPTELSRAQEALAIARRLDGPALIAQALLACGMLSFYDAEAADQSFAEAIDLVRVTGHRGACAKSSAIRPPWASLPANRSPRGRPPRRDVTLPMHSATSSSPGAVERGWAPR